MKTDFSFPRDQHIRHRKEFQYLFQKSFRLHGNFFIYRVLLKDQNPSRLGVVVSKKFGSAVYRNKIKRMVKEVFRHHDFSYSVDLVISQYKKVTSDTKKAKKELQTAFLFLTDYYFLLQCSVDHQALKTAQCSSTMSWGAKGSFHLVLWYKKYLSGQFKNACRFTPTCSVYALEAFRVYGFWKGWGLVIKRLCSCHPFGGQGYNPVPQKKIK